MTKQERHVEICEAINQLIADNGMVNRHHIRLEDAIEVLSDVYKKKHIKKAWEDVK